MRDGCVFEGTPRQIAQAMKAIAFDVESLSLCKYIDWVARSTLEFEGIELHVQGATENEKAAALVREMMANGLAALE
ncbi:MAG: hypothetical protein HY698_05530 [Deltaproteobacteria bacterium]|nr:hypothetical protein [Deltaproteobacteria bacterium]